MDIEYKNKLEGWLLFKFWKFWFFGQKWRSQMTLSLAMYFNKKESLDIVFVMWSD
jgi:hypothetical protein